jgi:hypothetical protein
MVDPLNVHVMAGKMLQQIDGMPETLEVKIAALRAAADTLQHVQAAKEHLLMMASILKR